MLPFQNTPTISGRRCRHIFVRKCRRSLSLLLFDTTDRKVGEVHFKCTMLLTDQTDHHILKYRLGIGHCDFECPI
jgi:hypothetical protein